MIRRPTRSTRPDALFPYKMSVRSYLCDTHRDMVRSIGSERGRQFARDMMHLIQLAKLDGLANRIAPPCRLADRRDAAVGKAGVELGQDHFRRLFAQPHLFRRPPAIGLGFLGQPVDRRPPAAGSEERRAGKEWVSTFDSRGV